MFKSKVNCRSLLFIRSSNNTLNPSVMASLCIHYNRCRPKAISKHICIYFPEMKLVIQLTPPVERYSRKALVPVWPSGPVHHLTKPYCGPAFLSLGPASAGILGWSAQSSCLCLSLLDLCPCSPVVINSPGILEPIFEPEPQPEVVSWRKPDLWPRLHQSLRSPSSALEPCPLGTLPGIPRRPSHS